MKILKISIGIFIISLSGFLALEFLELEKRIIDLEVQIKRTEIQPAKEVLFEEIPIGLQKEIESSKNMEQSKEEEKGKPVIATLKIEKDVPLSVEEIAKELEKEARENRKKECEQWQKEIHNNPDSYDYHFNKGRQAQCKCFKIDLAAESSNN